MLLKKKKQLTAAVDAAVDMRELLTALECLGKVDAILGDLAVAGMSTAEPGAP